MAGQIRRYQTEWEGLRLVIEEYPEHFHTFVYDPVECEVLYTAERMDLDGAKIAAVDFAAATSLGPRHDLKADVIAAMLIWEPVEK
jgi:hypothetical protein